MTPDQLAEQVAQIWWAWGDLIAATPPDQLAELFARHPGLDVDATIEAVIVAERTPPHRRRPDQPWQHHAMVHRVDPALADEILDALADGMRPRDAQDWTTRTLRPRPERTRHETLPFADDETSAA